MEIESKAPKKKTTPRRKTEKKDASKGFKRVLKGQETIYHDVFRLEVANLVRNESFNDIPLLVEIPHSHRFHNVNSDGKPQDKCSPVAGHFHEMIIEENDEGEMRVICGPAKKFARNKRGKKIIVDVVTHKDDFDRPVIDNHTHEVTYLQSEEIVRRVYKTDALKMISEIKNQEAKMLSNPTMSGELE